jgi:uncharacterized membrane protein
MDGLFILLALVVLAIPVCVVVLLVGQSSLKSRVRVLEERVRMLTAAQAGQPIPPPVAEPLPPQFAAAETDFPADPFLSDADEPTGAMPEAPSEPSDALPSGVWPAAPPQDGPVVLRPDRIAALATWMQRNWIYVISAASLALAGVFLVQYSVQNALLPPIARVIAAYLLGGALIVGGEWLRRRQSVGRGGDVEFLPAVFAGAGVVTLFAATVGAEQLYGLIGPNTAFALHMGVAALAVALGWFHGPLVTVVGLVGAAAAPFMVTPGEPTPWLYAYYALIAAAGLAVDAVRRWAWVSVLALVLGYVGGLLMMAGGAAVAGWIALLVILPILAIILPRLQVLPSHPAPAVLQSLVMQGQSGWPEFPVRLAAGAVLTSVLGIVMLPDAPALEGVLALGALAVLAFALLLWADRAEGLADLALLPAAAFVLRLWFDAVQYSSLFMEFWQQAITMRPPESAAPMTVTLILALAAGISGAFALRALQGGALSLVHGLAAVLVAPLAVGVLELAWYPAEVLGPWLWALHPMALAVAMVALAARFAGLDGADHRRMAYATLAALSLIALSLFILTSATALTLALAALIVVAAWLDRQFDLREMGLFIQIAVAVVAWRLMVDPGVDWALTAPVPAVLAVFAGAILADLAAIRLLQGRARILTGGVLESAAMTLAAILANVLLTRFVVPGGGFEDSLEYNFAATLNAMPWLLLALAQVYRAGLGPVLRRLRIALAVIAGLLATGWLLIAVIPLNPMAFSYADQRGALVLGPLVLDTLMLAYALPAALMLVAVWRLALPRALSVVLMAAGTALVALYVALEIRRFWQGDFLGGPTVGEYELYSYTVALMLVGAALLYQSIARRSAMLRRIAMTVIALTVAKVFLVDAAGLTGLTRVFSFLGLGLSLAGLAWLNRWAGQATER